MIYLLRYRQRYILFILSILFISLATVAQEEKGYVIPDSLSNKTYDYFLQKVQQNSTDTISSLTYINSYLAKAIDEDNGYRRHRAYIFLSYFATDKDAKLSLIEKALLDIKSLDDKNLIYLYIYIGTVYYDYYDYKTSIENYLKALKISEKTNDKEGEYILYNNIAMVKENIGKHDDALDLYKKCLAYETLKKDTIRNIETTLNVAESMRNNKMYDSATYYYQTIIDRANRDAPFYGDVITINEGINLFSKKKYAEAEQLLLKGHSQIDLTIESQKYYILATLYLGKIQLTLYNNEEKAKTYFKKVDSIVSETKAIVPNTIEAYEFLIKYYKKKEDIKGQLDAVTKLSELRATISLRKINTIDMLYSEFDTPQLLKSKEALIQQLEHKATTNSTRITYLIILILLLIALFVLQYRRHKKYRNRFNIIISELDHQETKSTLDHNTSNTPKLLLDGIDDATITTILHKLDQFEKKKGFLQKDITLAILAKKCATNTKYLPKIIHIHKDKSFVNYINNLRIVYILKELRENTILQKYTIKTISEEEGFNTAESFARAFKNKTGIRPSYYIRNLKKKEKL
jgi:AraC-like DNA-binding protein